MFLILPVIVPNVTPTCSLCFPAIVSCCPKLFLMLPPLVPYVTHSCSLCSSQLLLLLSAIVLYVTHSCSLCYPRYFLRNFRNEKGTRAEFRLAIVSLLESLLGTRQLTIGQFLCPHQTTYLSNLIGMAVRSSLLSLRSSPQK